MKFKSWIYNLPEYIPGKTLEEIKEKYNLDAVYKLASNESMFGTSSQVLDCVCSSAGSINYYPDSDCRQIKQKLSSKYDVAVDNIIIGSGTDQIIEMICDSFIGPGENAVISNPTFLIYEKSALKCGGHTIKVPLKDFRQNVNLLVDSIDNKTRIIFLTNPHNPAGTNITKDEFEYVVENTKRDILIVIDEAYYEYLPEEEKVDSISYLNKYSNLIILRTFSKIYGLAGLRIGYGISSAEIITGLNKIRLPFNVNLIAQKAAVAALENEWFINEIRDRVQKEKEKFYSAFKKAGIIFIKSYANFILIKTGEKSRSIVEELLKSGFIVRPGENLGLPGYIRVTISRAEINDKFLNIFIKIYTNHYN